MKCTDCDFYQAVDARSGECRESPPRVFLVPMRTFEGDGVGFSSNYPIVKPDGWCGAYQSELAESLEKPLALSSN